MPESHEERDEVVAARVAEPDHSEAEAGTELALAEEDAKVQQAIELLPPEQRAVIVSTLRRESMSHRGWLPTPAFMREYELVLPGLAERIVAMPEREQAFRHGTTKELVARDYRLRSTGQWLGIASLILLLAFCTLLVLLDHPTEAAWVAVATIVGTVGVFVAGQVSNKAGSSSKDLVEAEDES